MTANGKLPVVESVQDVPEIWDYILDTFSDNKVNIQFQQENDILHLLVFVVSTEIGYHTMWVWCGTEWSLYRLHIMFEDDDS